MKTIKLSIYFRIIIVITTTYPVLFSSKSYADDISDRCTDEKNLVILKNIWIKNNVNIIDVYDAQRNPYSLMVEPTLAARNLPPGGPLTGPMGPLILNSIKNDPSGQYKQCVAGAMTDKGEHVLYYSFVKHGKKDYIESNIVEDNIENVLATAKMINDSRN